MIIALLIVSCGVLAKYVAYQVGSAREQNVAAMVALSIVGANETTAQEVALRNGSRIITVHHWPASPTTARHISVKTQQRDSPYLGVATARSSWLPHRGDRDRLEFCCD